MRHNNGSICVFSWRWVADFTALQNLKTNWTMSNLDSHWIIDVGLWRNGRVAYHSENGVRAAAALVHLRLPIVTILCVENIRKFAHQFAVQSTDCAGITEMFSDLTFSFSDPGKCLRRLCHHFLSQVSHINGFLYKQDTMIVQKKTFFFCHLISPGFKVCYFGCEWVHMTSF